MKILDKNPNNDKKWTVVFDRTSKYPAPGTYISVSEDDLEDVIVKSNTLLEKDETFLQSSITNMNETNYYNRTIFAPCAAELTAKRKFDVVLRVESLKQVGNKTYAITNCPFINMPKGVEMMFDADEATVVDVKIATEKPLSSQKAFSMNALRLSSYVNKENETISYEMLIPAPLKILSWLSSNLVKEFSLIFDFTKEIEIAVNEISSNNSIPSQHKAQEPKFLKEGEQPTKLKLEVRSLNSLTENDTVNEKIASTEEDAFDDFVHQHPLYNYTSDVVVNVLDEIEKTCRLTLDDDIVSGIMENILHRMLSTKMSITPPTHEDEDEN